MRTFDVRRAMQGVAAIALAGGMSAAAFAQVTTPLAPTREEIERTTPAPEATRAPKLEVEAGAIERAPCALADPAYQAVTFQLTAVEFADLQQVTAEDLRSTWQEYAGTTQPVSVICEIRDRAATILRERGYVAAVEVPEQRIEGGTVRFQVLMARLVGVRVRGNAGKAETMIAGYLNKLTSEPVFNRFTAERYLLLAGDLPGYDVRLALRSAEAGRGEVIGEVAVLKGPDQIDVNIQNFGSNQLGRFGALVSGQFYGLTGWGDRTTIALFSTLDFKEQQTLQLGHEFRVGSEGLTFSGRYTHAWADPDIGLANADVKAVTRLATFEAAYPFIRSQTRNIRGAIGLDYVDQRVRFNDVLLSKDRLRVGYVRVDFDEIDPDSLARRGGYSAIEPRWQWGGSVELRQGLDIFDASPRCIGAGACPGQTYSTSRPFGDATAFVYRAGLNGEYRPIPNITFSLGVRAQYSRRPLLGFEEFSTGNYTVGRGYDPGTLLGDSGAGFQAEIRWGSILPQSADSLSFQPYLFLDGARVRNRDLADPYAADLRDLFSAGAGLRALYGDKAQLDVTFAAPLSRAGLLASRPDPRLLISFTTRLLPWSYR